MSEKHAGFDFVKDKVSGLWRTLTREELEEAATEHGEYRPNREAIRRYHHSLRRKGPGYTRRMRKGRIQRGSS